MVKTLSSRAAQEKMTLLLGPASKPLFRELDRADVALGLRASTATNSRTAGRLAAKEAVENIQGASPLQELAKGRPIDGVQRIVQALTGATDEMSNAQKQKLFGEITDLLTRNGGNTPERLLNTLRRVNAGQPVAEAQARYLANSVVGLLASPAYRTGVQVLERNQQ